MKGKGGEVDMSRGIIVVPTCIVFVCTVSSGLINSMKVEWVDSLELGVFKHSSLRAWDCHVLSLGLHSLLAFCSDFFFCLPPILGRSGPLGSAASPLSYATLII